MSTTPELQEATDFFDPAILIPVRDKVYRIRPVSAETGLILQNARAAAAKAQEDGTDPNSIVLEGPGAEDTREDTERRLFGDAYDEMIADGVSDFVRFRLTQIVTIWTFSGFEAAKAYVATGGKALTLPNRSAQRMATRTRTGAANTGTGSATTTSTPKATAPKAAPGKKSSPTGTRSKATSKTSE